MEKHATVLGALFLGVGIMGLIGLIVVLVIFSIGSAALGTAAAQDPSIPRFLVLLPATFGLFIAAIIALTTIPNFFAAYGLLARRPWGRIVGLVVGILNLPAFPLGTALGGYAIWFFVQDEPTPGQQQGVEGRR